MVAVTMFLVGSVVSIWHGIEHILHPHEMEHATIMYIVLGLSAVFEAGPWFVAFRQMRSKFKEKGVFRTIRESKSPAIVTVFLEDTAAMIGLFVAAAGIALSQLTGNSVWDGAASITIGVVLFCVAAILSFETKSLLIGEGVSKQDNDAIREAIVSEDSVTGIVDLLTMHIGPDSILVNTSVCFRDGMDTDEVERAVDAIEKAIREAVPDTRWIYVEPEQKPGCEEPEPGEPEPHD